MFKIIALYMMALFVQLYVKIDILLTCGKHLHDSIISLKWEILTHTTILTSPLFIESPAPSQDSERSCICGRDIEIASFYGFDIRFCQCFSFYYMCFIAIEFASVSTSVLLDFETVPCGRHFVSILLQK